MFFFSCFFSFFRLNFQSFIIFYGKNINVWTLSLKRCLWRYEGLANVFFQLTVSLMLQISPQCIEYQLISFPFWPHSRSHSPSVLFLFSPTTTTSPVLLSLSLSLSLRSLAVSLCWLFFFFFHSRFPSLVIWPKFILSPNGFLGEVKNGILGRGLQGWSS